MPSLLELQERFAADLTGAASAGHAVYRNTSVSNYRNALAATYPVVKALVGRAFFDAAVDHFVAAHPPVAGDLNVYGDAFPNFLERYPPAHTLAYLPDVARLEWLLDESMRAADATGDPARVVATLAGMSEAALDAARVRLHPSCRWMVSRFDGYGIWKAHRHGDGTGWSEGAMGTAQHVMTRRENERGVVERVDPAEHAWLTALAEGTSLGQAVPHALAVDAAFDLAAAFQRRIADGTLVAIENG